jgi:hypothetical protein
MPTPGKDCHTAHPAPWDLTGSRVARELSKAVEWLVRIALGKMGNSDAPPSRRSGRDGEVGRTGRRSSTSEVGIVPNTVCSVKEALPAIGSLPEDPDSVLHISAPRPAAETPGSIPSPIGFTAPTGTCHPITRSAPVIVASGLPEAGYQSGRADKTAREASAVAPGPENDCRFQGPGGVERQC